MHSPSSIIYSPSQVHRKECRVKTPVKLEIAMEMDCQPHQLKLIFLPYLTPGHMIPMVDTARLFAKHDVDVTIITTKANALTFQKAIDSDFNSGYPIRTLVIQFPAAQVGLPEGVENFNTAVTGEMQSKLYTGIAMLKEEIELLFEELQPDCLVTDMLYPWTVESAAKLGVPRLYFFVTSIFSNCTRHSIRKHKPYERLVSDTQKFLIPDLPHNIEMTPLQIEEWIRTPCGYSHVMGAVYESESRSYGTVFNSFHELEGEYEKLYKSTMGVKAWSIGPVSAWVNKDDGEKANRGNSKEALAEEPEWLNWLNSREKESVLYVSFGSLVKIPYVQLVEIAHGLENSGHNFIWVVRNQEGDSFLQDFEQRMKEKDKGHIIWKWAPQLLILEHPAIGGIVTQCGWNSILESLNAGLPMITWPVFSEQFYNEKFITDVLKIGVPVGMKENKLWTKIGEEAQVSREEIVKAVELLMRSDEESKERRRRARKLGDSGKRAAEEGGSSYNSLLQLIDELKSLKKIKSTSQNNLDN